ncbi:MAG TPA: alginate lyase family protein, partial [bacterium]|nr:alginate lyase family protein [bacterium]
MQSVAGAAQQITCNKEPNPAMDIHFPLFSFAYKAAVLHHVETVLFFWAVCLSLLTLSPNAHSVERPESVVPSVQEHPYLFITRSDIPDIMARVEKHDWAKKTYEGILENAERLLEEDLIPPPSTGRHSMVYMCPDCGGLLKTLSPTEHQCKDCQKIHTGMPFDAVLYKSQHGKLENAAMTLGLASLFTGKDVYARKALEILLKYADVYDTYPMINPYGEPRANGARIYDQTLNEAIWLVSISWAYDLILATDVATTEEKRHVEEHLIRPSVMTVRKNPSNRISNWQTWHNAGMLAAGLCLRDQEIIDHALLADGGYFYQLEHSIKEEGMQYEGSWSYHFYALHAFLKTAEMGHKSGLNTYGHEPLRRALLLPLQMAMPNGKLPAIHDGTEWAPSTTYYEYAAARYDEPAFEDFLAQHKRVGWEALLMGIDDPQPHPTPLQSVVLNDSGLAVLRRGGSYLLLDFGEHGGGHGHYDKLNVVYFTQGSVVASDPG